MLEAMLRARVGDDVLDGDPTLAELEAFVADWLGKDGALFVPSGTMANQVALGAWTRPGDEVVVQRWAHVTTFEGGAAGYLHGLQSITLGGIEGRMDPAEVAASIRPDYIHCPRTALVCVEQTHNVAGGRIVPLEELRAIRACTAERGVPVHLDGARLANAVVASGVDARTWAACADSVSLCLSKGLRAPVGSLIAGPADFIERARVVRKRLGGWMRQAGILGAAGLHAMQHNIERLAEDHALARELATRLGALPGLSADPGGVDTNIVMVQVDPELGTAAEVAARIEAGGARAIAMGPQTLRFCTHADVGPEEVTRLEEAARACVASG